MTVKYRVGDVAKDLGVASKDIIALLAEYVDTPKKSVTTLTEEELNIIFEHYTQKNSVKSLDAYFAAADKRREQSAAAAKKAKEEEAEALRRQQEEAAAELRRLAEEAAAAEKAKADAEKAKADAEAKAKAAAKKAEEEAKKAAEKKEIERRAAEKRAAEEKKAAEKKAAQPPVVIPPQQPKKKKEKNENAAPVAREIERRTVDTRAPQQVSANKYDEKYDVMAQSSNRVRGEGVAQKQKINQKSQQYKKPQRRRETEAERMRRIQLERQKKPVIAQVGETITVGEFASRLKVTSGEVIKKLMLMGVMASVNEEIDFDTAYLVAEELGAKVEREVVVTIEERIIDDSEDTAQDLQPRDPVVVVMGHVDHGKTSILDAIRKTNVTAGEAGGITQHIGAYRVDIGDGTMLTFLDTPGHAAFTSMRARGAQATDIAILVVAADDGIMPQTIEAINHAKAAGIDIVVAVNKMDKPTANPDRVLQQLTEHELVPEEWGGDVICVPVSALTGMGIDRLLESVQLVAEMKELRANPDRAAKGVVIEARLDKGRGPIATVLVQNGTLRSGDILVAGTAVGRVRSMSNERGEKIREAGPSVPVEIMGLDSVPTAGDVFNAVTDERLARELVEQRRDAAKEEQFKQYQKVTLDNLFDQMQQGEMKELNVIVKADVQGSVEAVRQSLEKLTNEEVRVRVIHGAVGAVSESDVMLANASNAIIVGFNVRPEPLAIAAAKAASVDMRMYRIIYDCIEEIESAMKGMLAPKTREVLHGRAEVREVYKISGVGTVAGCYITDGKVYRNDLLRVVREGIIIADDKMISLKRFKDDQREVAEGYECGIGLEKFNDIHVGDVFETYIIEEYRD